MKNVLKVLDTDKAAAFGPPDDFSGEFQICRKNGKVVYRVEYRDGKRDGQHCSYWEDGKLAVVGYACNDIAVGTWLHFMEGGSLMFEERFSGNEGTYSTRWFDVLGRVTRIVLFRDGVEFASREFER